MRIPPLQITLSERRFSKWALLAACSLGVPFSSVRAELESGGVSGDDQLSVVYDAGTGEIALDVPPSLTLTSLDLRSESGIFTGDPAMNLGGTFDIFSSTTIFKFGSGGFGSLSFGNVAQSGLSEAVVLADLTAGGSIAPAGALPAVDLVYRPRVPVLQIASSGPSEITLSWRDVSGRWDLEESTSLKPKSWRPYTGPISTFFSLRRATIPIGSRPKSFYRLVFDS